MNTDLMKDIQKYEKEIIRLRRLFHTCPETAWQEEKTTALIQKYLDELDIPWDSLPIKEHHTGLMAHLDCGNGPVLTLRFDIDGLPIEESHSSKHHPCREGFLSQHPGAMHACGHDGHIAIGLMTAKLLQLHQRELQGHIQLLFQPAEEGCRGALPIVESGLMASTDIFLAGHIVPAAEYPEADEDFIAVSNSLATEKLDITYHGKAAHAGNPRNGLSVMPALGQLLTSLYEISRDTKDALLNIGTVKAGNSRNIIADYAHLELEVRGKTTDICKRMAANAKESAFACAKRYGITGETTLVGSAPSMQSSLALVQDLHLLFRDPTSPIHASDQPTTIFKASEDAAHLMECVKNQGGQAAYLLFPAHAGAALHQPLYTFDESVLTKAVAFYCLTVLHLMKN